MAGRSGCDLVQPSASFVQRMEVYDPGMRHAVPYISSIYGLALDVEKVRARLGSDVAPTTIG